MHTKLIENASLDVLKEFSLEALSIIKKKDRELYKELELCLYKKIYGCHFNEWSLKKATEHLQNEDGTTGAYWDIEKTNSLARQNGITFTDFNEYDWNYVVNIMYSDYYGAVNNDATTYVKMAKKFLTDKDAPKGKAFIYYLALDD